MPFGRTTRYLRRLRASDDPRETLRLERVLATARLALALLALIAIWLDPTEPTRFATLAYVLLVAYLVYSCGVWALLRRSTQPPRIPWILWVDLVFPTVFMLFTEGPNSPFFMFFVFVLTTAAFRGGFFETLLTSAAAGALVTLEALVIVLGPQSWHVAMGESFEVNRYVIRISFLLVVALLIGYMAEQDKQAQAENEVLRRMMERARPDGGLRAALAGIFSELSRVFPCNEVRLFLRHQHTGGAFEWIFDPASSHLSLRETDGDEAVEPLFPAPVAAFHVEWRRGVPTAWLLDGKGTRLRSAASAQELARISPSNITGVLFTWGDEWNGRLLLPGSQFGLDKVRELRFAQRIERQIGPAIYGVYLMRRLRSRAGAIERARVARELHDGVIQALVGMEMQVEVLRKRTACNGADPSLPRDLEHIRDLLREQTYDMRALMQQMKPLDLTPKQLLDFLADAVDRFRRDTGITAQFVSELADVDLPPRLCRELARIAQEALVNVRKHSGAHNVLVRFASSEGKCRLTVDDDGQGFDFVGRVGLQYLDAAHKGPQVIKERVRNLGGELVIESMPGHGARLEVTIARTRPVSAYA